MSDNGRSLKFMGFTKDVFLLVLLLVVIAALVMSLIAHFEFRQLNARVTRDLCAGQSSLVDMQRLFLQEHAAIRVQLEHAGIPNQHADPGLLKRLEDLIEASDCDPDSIRE